MLLHRKLGIKEAKKIICPCSGNCEQCNIRKICKNYNYLIGRDKQYEQNLQTVLLKSRK